MLGFQGFWTAKRTLAGIEAMAMLTKGQVRAVSRGDMPAQRAFVQQILGLIAEQREVGQGSPAVSRCNRSTGAVRAKHARPRCRSPCWGDSRWNWRLQGRGLGQALLRDAILRVVGAAEMIGVRALLVHAISNDHTYERCGFRPSPVEPMTLMVTIDEARRMLAV